MEVLAVFAVIIDQLVPSELPSTLYPVMLYPFDCGADQERLMLVADIVVNVNPDGCDGTSPAVTASDVVPAGPVPSALIASTRNWYDVPDVRPDSV